MTTTISSYINHQQAPALLLRFPRLLFLYYLGNRLTVLRTWYVRRAFRSILKELQSPRNIFDAGCGMGDFIFSIPELTSSDRITGIDASASNILLCEKLAETLKRKNLSFIQNDLRNAELPPNQDIILCIAVLMYIEDDIVLLTKFKNALTENGKLILYVPVNYQRHLSLYKKLSKKSGFDYDQSIGRPQTYTDSSILQKLEDSGFLIEEQRHSFGVFAAIMFEVLAIIEWVIKTKHFIVAILAALLFFLFFPFNLLAMIIDYFGTRTTGNGIIIIAKKK